MSYTVVLSPDATSQRDALPDPLPAFISAQLLRLSENPTALSRPATLLQPRGQLFEINYDRAGVVVWISIIFRFGADEQTIHVEHIASEFG